MPPNGTTPPKDQSVPPLFPPTKNTALPVAPKPVANAPMNLPVAQTPPKVSVPLPTRPTILPSMPPVPTPQNTTQKLGSVIPPSPAKISDGNLGGQAPKNSFIVPPRPIIPQVKASPDALTPKTPVAQTLLSAPTPSPKPSAPIISTPPNVGAQPYARPAAPSFGIPKPLTPPKAVPFVFPPLASTPPSPTSPSKTSDGSVGGQTSAPSPLPRPLPPIAPPPRPAPLFSSPPTGNQASNQKPIQVNVQQDYTWSWGTYVGISVLVLTILTAALYLWGSYLDKQARQTNGIQLSQ